jgi:hypothetical protein
VAGTTRRSPDERVARAPHTQKLTLLDRQHIPHVESCQFIAHVDTTSIKFDRHGALLVTLVVPAEFAEYGLDVRFLAGIPLSVDIQRWKVAPNHPSIPPTA